MKIIVAIVISFVILNTCFAQTSEGILKQMDEIEKTCQSCCDAGVNFVDCETIFYNKPDSILNSVYKRLKAQMSTADFLVLKKEQINWLKKRNVYFKKQEFQIGKDKAGFEADRALAIQLDTLYVEDRIKHLLKSLKS